MLVELEGGTRVAGLKDGTPAREGDFFRVGAIQE